MAQAPYKKLERAEQDARERFPDAQRVQALWTPASVCEVHVEVWHEQDRATVHGWHPTNGK